MTHCWQEGALRAYLDGELSGEDRQQVAAHLKECTDCSGLYTELSARAAMVGALMDLLPEGTATTTPRLALAPRRRDTWVLAAVALAAMLALAAYLVPPRRPPVHAIVLPPPASVPAAEVVAEAAMPAPVAPALAPELAVAASLRRPRRDRVTLPAPPEPEQFVALDDEPFESGVIMRLNVKPGNVQADIVFGPDGRAHAFRLVSATQRNF